MSKRTTPTRGQAFREAVTGAFELRPDEEALLHEAVATIDRIDALDAIVEKDGLVVRDARGVAMHPAATESRQLRIVLRGYLRALRLPDADGVDDVTRQARANGSRSKRRSA